LTDFKSIFGKNKRRFLKHIKLIGKTNMQNPLIVM